MNHRPLSYQSAALYKLIAFKDALAKTESDLNQKNASHHFIDAENKKTIESFITTFCEYDLADTNYIDVQAEAVGYRSLSEYIKKRELDLPAILKCLTYFIWTDRIIEGYLVSKIKDNSLNIILTRLSSLLREEHQPVSAG